MLVIDCECTIFSCVVFRYVQEWLGVMTTGYILDLTTDSEGVNRFMLPEYRRKALSNKDGGGAMAVFSWTLPLLAHVEPDLRECFKKDGPSGMLMKNVHETNASFWGESKIAKYKCQCSIDYHTFCVFPLT